MKAELKPCPFCGGDAEMNIIEWPKDKNWWDTYWINCKDCLAETSGFASEKEVIAAWNRRTEVTNE